MLKKIQEIIVISNENKKVKEKIANCKLKKSLLIEKKLKNSINKDFLTSNELEFCKAEESLASKLIVCLSFFLAEFTVVNIIQKFPLDLNKYINSRNLSWRGDI